jgi:hypothetical protein
MCLVKCCHSWGKGVLLGGLDRGNIPFLSILNTFHLDSFIVLYFGNGCYMYPKKVCTSSSYEKKGLEC